MRAGLLDRRVQLLAPSAETDAVGAPVVGWTPVATVWGSVVDLNGREFIAAGGVQNSVTTKIMIRYRSGVVPQMRAQVGADAYNIEAVLGQDRRGLVLMCSRGVSDA